MDAVSRPAGKGAWDEAQELRPAPRSCPWGLAGCAWLRVWSRGPQGCSGETAWASAGLRLCYGREGRRAETLRAGGSSAEEAPSPMP